MTPVQKQILDFIVAFRAERGYSPTLREIADMRGVSKVTVFEQTGELLRKGHLMKGKHKARNLVPADGKSIQVAQIIRDVADRLNELPNFQKELRRAAGILMGA